MRNQTPRTLDDMCEFIVDCLHATAPVQDEGYPLIRTPNVGKGRLDLDGVYRVSEETYSKWTRRAVPVSGDLILAREAPAGNVAIVKNGQTVCLGQRTVHLRPDPEQVYPDYLCYFLLAPKQQGLLLAGETGATSKHVNMKDIRRLPIEALPKLEVQENIGRMLAAYDDLIENNRRRIELLEESARLLYKEWFVHLRFPGHEHVKIVDGVPEGWERKTFGDAVENFDRQRVPLSVMEREKRPGPFPYHGAAGVLDHIDEYLFDGRYLLVGEDGTVITRNNTAMLQLVQGKFWVSNHAHVVLGRLVSTEFLYCFMQHYPIIGHITGVAQPKLSQKNLNRIEILIPKTQLHSLFQDAVAPLIDQVFTLNAANAKLAQARDLLLPKFMNGELVV